MAVIARQSVDDGSRSSGILGHPLQRAARYADPVTGGDG
jgi:hypothetical protein